MKQQHYATKKNTEITKTIQKSRVFLTGQTKWPRKELIGSRSKLHTWKVCAIPISVEYELRNEWTICSWHLTPVFGFCKYFLNIKSGKIGYRSFHAYFELFIVIISKGAFWGAWNSATKANQQPELDMNNTKRKYTSEFKEQVRCAKILDQKQTNNQN